MKIVSFTVTIRDEMLHFAKQMKAFTLGPFNPSINIFHWLKCILHKHLPSDAHQMANGHLAVAMTRLTDGKHTVISEFHSKEDVVQVSFTGLYLTLSRLETVNGQVRKTHTTINHFLLFMLSLGSAM